MASQEVIEQRLEEVVKRLLQGELLKSSTIAELLGVSQKTASRYLKKVAIQRPHNRISYNSTGKVWQADNTDSSGILLSEEDAFIISLLRQSAQEHGKPFLKKAETFFENYKQSISNKIYSKTYHEDLQERINDLLHVEKAIESCNVLQLTYNHLERIVHPYHIANFDGYWYLFGYDTTKEGMRNFYFKATSNINVLNETFKPPSDETLEKINNAVNAYFSYEREAFEVQLLLDTHIAKTFLRIPINNTQRIMQRYANGDVEISLVVHHELELLPTVQKWLPFIKVIEPTSLHEKVCENAKAYLEA